MEMLEIIRNPATGFNFTKLACVRMERQPIRTFEMKCDCDMYGHILYRTPA